MYQLSPPGPLPHPCVFRVRAYCQNQQVNHFVLTSTPDLSQFGITKDKVFTIPHRLPPAPVHRVHLLAASTRPLLPCGVTSCPHGPPPLLLVAMRGGSSLAMVSGMYTLRTACASSDIPDSSEPRGNPTAPPCLGHKPHPPMPHHRLAPGESPPIAQLRDTLKCRHSR